MAYVLCTVLSVSQQSDIDDHLVCVALPPLLPHVVPGLLQGLRVK